MSVGIEAIEFAIPEKSIDIANYCSDFDGEVKAFLEQAGIATVPDSGDSCSIDLAIQAAKKLFEQHQLLPNDIDAVLYLQPRSPKFLMSSELMMLCDALDLQCQHVYQIGGLGCVDSSAALNLAMNLCSSNHVRRVLIVAGSKAFSPIRHRYPVTIIGDAGMALTISSDDLEHNIVDVLLETNGKYANLFELDYKRLPSKTWHDQCKDEATYSFKLALESRNRLEALLNSALSKHNLRKADISTYYMQNISESAFSFYEEALSIQFSQTCKNNLRQYGHLGGIDIFLNYFYQMKIKKGWHVIMNNSPVAAWSLILFNNRIK